MYEIVISGLVRTYSFLWMTVEKKYMFVKTFYISDRFATAHIVRIGTLGKWRLSLGLYLPNYCAYDTSPSLFSSKTSEFPRTISARHNLLLARRWWV